jgi:hypothetical protein
VIGLNQALLIDSGSIGTMDLLRHSAHAPDASSHFLRADSLSLARYCPSNEMRAGNVLYKSGPEKYAPTAEHALPHWLGSLIPKSVESTNQAVLST